MKYPTIGLDYHNTITRDHRLFEDMARSLMDAGHEVYIITALKANPSQTAIDERENIYVPNNGVEYVYFNDYSEIAPLKLEVCLRLRVGLMFDDMPSVCKLLTQHGIVTAQIR